MLIKIIGTLFIISILMIFIGIVEFFTVKYGDKWYPGLSASFIKLPDEISINLVFGGIVLLLLAVILGAIFKV